MKPKRKCNAEMTTDQDFVDCPKNSLWGGSDAIFAVRLVDWQRRCGRRDLPWQGNDPYRVWLSEVMLQQTQTARVAPKFDAWMSRFPDAAALAASSTADIYDAWRGLGYNSRGPRLRACAVTCVERYGGVPPADERLLRELPGVGRYSGPACSPLPMALELLSLKQISEPRSSSTSFQKRSMCRSGAGSGCGKPAFGRRSSNLVLRAYGLRRVAQEA